MVHEALGRVPDVHRHGRLLPLEIYELHDRVSVLKVIGFVINIAVVVYLLYAKRLFGLRGGGRIDEELRARDMSWETIEAATPPPPEGPD